MKKKLPGLFWDFDILFMGLNGVCVSMATAEVQALVQLTTHTLTYQVFSNCGVTVLKSFQKLFHTFKHG